FVYLDERDTPLFRVCRTQSKRFFQQRPDGKGGWIAGIKGIRRVLYQLPKLIAGQNSGHIVFVVEGEKHVNALIRLGLRSTCNSAGAGNWLPKYQYNKFLKDQDVVILPDNDPQATDTDGNLKFHKDGRPIFPGQDHAQDVARDLYGTAKRVRVLMLPNLKPKGDIINWLEAGGTPEELLKLAAATPDWKPKSEPDDDVPPHEDDVLPVMNAKHCVMPIGG